MIKLKDLYTKNLTEAEMPDTEKLGRNNPDWINLVSKLKTLSYSPRILTFMDFDGIPSQSLNWGTTKSARGKYGFALASTSPNLPKERMDLFNTEDKENQIEMINWWKSRGYQIDNRSEISINFKDANKLRNDIDSFFKIYPPE
jgi:hypothetical protein